MVGCLLSSGPGPLLTRAPGRAPLPGSCPILSLALRFGGECQGRGTATLQTLKARSLLLRMTGNQMRLQERAPKVEAGGRPCSLPVHRHGPHSLLPGHGQTWPSLVPVGVGEQSGADSHSSQGRARGGSDRAGPGS